MLGLPGSIMELPCNCPYTNCKAYNVNSHRFLRLLMGMAGWGVLCPWRGVSLYPLLMAIQKHKYPEPEPELKLKRVARNRRAHALRFFRVTRSTFGLHLRCRPTQLK